MKKGVFILCLAICVLFAFSSVCAGDVSDNVIASEDNNQIVKEPNDSDLLISDDDNQLIGNNIDEELLSNTITVDGNKFSDIRTAINSANSGDTIKLNGTYINDLGGVIYVGTEDLIIDGGGNTILDGNSSRIFNIQEKNIVIKNVKFINGYSSYGGAIGVFSDNCLIDNCQFIKCGSSYKGGAIHFNARFDHMNITNCIFQECYSQFGAAFSVDEMSYGHVYDCTFEKCRATVGGILSANQDYSFIRAYNCIFKDNLSPISTSSDNVEIYSTQSTSPNTKTTKLTPKLTAKKATFKAKTKIKKYTAILKTNKNKAMKKVKLYLKVNGKTYTAKTNNKGKAIFKIKNLKKKGIFKAKITFKGNKNYKKVTKTVKIKVK